MTSSWYPIFESLKSTSKFNRLKLMIEQTKLATGSSNKNTLDRIKEAMKLNSSSMKKAVESAAAQVNSGNQDEKAKKVAMETVSRLIKE